MLQSFTLNYMIHNNNTHILKYRLNQKLIQRQLVWVLFVALTDRVGSVSVHWQGGSTNYQDVTGRAGASLCAGKEDSAVYLSLYYFCYVTGRVGGVHVQDGQYQASCSLSQYCR